MYRRIRIRKNNYGNESGRPQTPYGPDPEHYFREVPFSVKINLYFLRISQTALKVLLQ
jgi:hypothetical protein